MELTDEFRKDNQLLSWDDSAEAYAIRLLEYLIHGLRTYDLSERGLLRVAANSVNFDIETDDFCGGLPPVHNDDDYIKRSPSPMLSDLGDPIDFFTDERYFMNTLQPVDEGLTNTPLRRGSQMIYTARHPVEVIKMDSVNNPGQALVRLHMLQLNRPTKVVDCLS